VPKVCGRSGELGVCAGVFCAPEVIRMCVCVCVLSGKFSGEREVPVSLRKRVRVEYFFGAELIYIEGHSPACSKFNYVSDMDCTVSA